MLKPINNIHVYYSGGAKKVSVGRLAYNNHRIFFEYSQEFLKSGLELSPFKLPLKAGVYPCSDFVFDGLFGVFNDSLPDGWGRLLLDRKLMKHGINTESLTPLDRLRYVGRMGMGALSYEPEMEHESVPEITDLDVIADEVLSFQEQDSEQYIEDLLIMNGSSAGARPKILVNITEKGFQTTDNNTTSPHNDWLIKFRSSLDPIDIGPIEYAYHLMGKAAGLNLPEAKVFKSKKSNGYFGVKRFDHEGSKRLHMHTASGLLHADHRFPSLDYETLLKATLWLTKDRNECEIQFRNAVFNVLSHNRDDHAKNFSFLMNEKGLWRVSPAYDLTFSSGPAGEHCTTVMREGKAPKLHHFLKLAELIDMPSKKAQEIVEEVKKATSEWQVFAEEAKVAQKSNQKIKVALDYVAREFNK